MSSSSGRLSALILHCRLAGRCLLLCVLLVAVCASCMRTSLSLELRRQPEWKKKSHVMLFHPLRRSLLVSIVTNYSGRRGRGQPQGRGEPLLRSLTAIHSCALLLMRPSSSSPSSSPAFLLFGVALCWLIRVSRDSSVGPASNLNFDFDFGSHSRQLFHDADQLLLPCDSSTLLCPDLDSQRCTMAGVTAMKPVTGVSAGVCRRCRARGPIVAFFCSFHGFFWRPCVPMASRLP